MLLFSHPPTVRLAAWFSVLALAGCDAAPPRPPVGPGTDAGRPADGGSFDAPYVRPTEPMLPPADVDLVLPYLGPSQAVTLEVDAALGRLDVAFSIDTTGSFGGEIDALQSTLESRILPALDARVADVGVAVASFEDFPVTPFGVEGDIPFLLHTAVTTDRNRARAGVAALALGNGGDLPESGAESLYQIATGAGIELDGATLVPRFRGTGEGGVGFRPGSLRVVVHVTDAPTHEPSEYGPAIPAHGSSAAISALAPLGVRVIGVASHENARAHLESWAIATGAVVAPTSGSCRTGRSGAARPPSGGVCPLVFDIGADGSGLSDAIVDAMTDLLEAIAWSEAHGETVSDPLHFVRAIEAAEATPPAGASAPDREDRVASDGVLDTFTGVAAGTTLRFVAHLENRSVEPADYEQVFRVTIRILGDGLVIAERVVRITVPAGRRDAGLRDGGIADAPDDAPDDAGEADAGAPDAGGDAG